MDPLEFCKLKHDHCVCAERGEALCAQVIRQAQDPEEVEKARRAKGIKEEDRKSRYVEDEPFHRAILSRGIIPSAFEASRREYRIDFKKNPFLEDVRAKFHLEIEQESHRIKEEIESIWVRPEVDLPTAKERRLGSSDKDYVKFHKDPVRHKG